MQVPGKCGKQDVDAVQTPIRSPPPPARLCRMLRIRGTDLIMVNIWCDSHLKRFNLKMSRGVYAFAMVLLLPLVAVGLQVIGPPDGVGIGDVLLYDLDTAKTKIFVVRSRGFPTRFRNCNLASISIVSSFSSGAHFFCRANSSPVRLLVYPVYQC